MKYTGNTISKPIVGKEAKILSKAINKGGFVANEQALATAKRIVQQILLDEKH